MNHNQLITQLQQLIESQASPLTADPHPLIQAALTAYQTARTDGLCHEGAWEIALQTFTQKRPSSIHEPTPSQSK